MAMAYISGPMTGYPDNNRAAFNEAARKLEERDGWTVVNPVDSDSEVRENPEWSDYLRKDLRNLTLCTAVFVLDGWENSRGARLEVFTAFNLGIEIWKYDAKVGNHFKLMHRTDVPHGYKNDS